MGTGERYSRVSRRIWNDANFRSLSAPQPNAQTLWFRLLTGPELSVIPGLFQCYPDGLAQALGWSLDAFRYAMSEVIDHGMMKVSDRNGLIWIPKAIHHNPPQSVNVITGWGSTWSLLPECELKNEAHSTLYAFVDGMSKGFREAFVKACGKPSPIQDQEQDQDLQRNHGSKTARGPGHRNGSAPVGLRFTKPREPDPEPDTGGAPVVPIVQVLPEALTDGRDVREEQARQSAALAVWGEKNGA